MKQLDMQPKTGMRNSLIENHTESFETKAYSDPGNTNGLAN